MSRSLGDQQAGHREMTVGWETNVKRLGTLVQATALPLWEGPAGSMLGAPLEETATDPWVDSMKMLSKGCVANLGYIASTAAATGASQRLSSVHATCP
eukprot:3583040-Pleurochrysis_carterae.AAC.4